jgi:hypothetical protein
MRHVRGSSARRRPRRWRYEPAGRHGENVTLRLFALRLAASLLDVVAARSAAASLALLRAMHEIDRTAVHAPSEPRLLLFDGEVYLIDSRGVISPLARIDLRPSRALTFVKGGRA